MTEIPVTINGECTIVVHSTFTKEAPMDPTVTQTGMICITVIVALVLIIRAFRS